ncbi:phage portal protein [Paenibacillus thiaminolyticus]|uniref:phage portal protein n=1 Tax=Paenibacillus thiaminolyticus TaxID=49283 RepID=UPI0011649CAE|nr:phage portal protein [Paenibacillus thiaminolyticus]NGP58160.1 phage portal protein [Paenibacillus thiaminolyticus]
MMPAMEEVVRILQDGANAAMTLEQIIQAEISDWEGSEKRKWMLIGDRYYRNKTDIQKRKRTAIDEDGKLAVVEHLPNNRLVNGFVRKLVDQKTDYLLSKPLSIQTDNKEYQELLTEYFGKSMLRILRNLGKSSINKGIAWLHVFYDERGELSFKPIPSEEIIPLWKDAAHTELDAVIRKYEIEAYEGINRITISKVEWWDTKGVRRYEYRDSTLTVDVEMGEVAPHFAAIDDQGKETAMAWEKVPFIAFKYNDEEQPLVELIKTLVDNYDRRKSDNANDLEDLPNNIIAVRGFGGSSAGEIRKNLSTYKIIKIDLDETGNGAGVDTISIQIDTEAHEAHMKRNRKDIYEFGRGVDTQSENFGGDKSGVALRFLYSDLDMDANGIETEFQASLEQLRWFIDTHIENTTKVDYSNETVEFIFNRDIIINESEAIKNVKDSVGTISEETIIANHPWVTNTKEEMKRILEERSEGEEDNDTYATLRGKPTAGEDE